MKTCCHLWQTYSRGGIIKSNYCWDEEAEHTSIHCDFSTSIRITQKQSYAMSEWVNQIMIYKNDGYISLKEKAWGGLLQGTQYSPPTRNRASSVKNTKSSRNQTLLLNKEVQRKTWDWFVLLKF